MADAILCDEILVRLREQDHVTVDSPSQFRDAAGLNSAWSKTEVKKALGSLIKNRRVRRFRPRPQGCTDQGQPITFRLAT